VSPEETATVKVTDRECREKSAIAAVSSNVKPAPSSIFSPIFDAPLSIFSPARSAGPLRVAESHAASEKPTAPRRIERLHDREPVGGTRSTGSVPPVPGGKERQQIGRAPHAFAQFVQRAAGHGWFHIF
jgi:hypothetical protein